MELTIIPNGTPVRVRETREKGIVVSSEVKRFPNINNGKEIRYYIVELHWGNKFEYESSELSTSV